MLMSVVFVHPTSSLPSYLCPYHMKYASCFYKTPPIYICICIHLQHIICSFRIMYWYLITSPAYYECIWTWQEWVPFCVLIFIFLWRVHTCVYDLSTEVSSFHEGQNKRVMFVHMSLSADCMCVYVYILCRMWTEDMDRGRAAVTPMFLQLRRLRRCGKREHLNSPQIVDLMLTASE